MAIRKGDFSGDKFQGKGSYNPIVSFLRKNRGRAFKSTEIAKALGRDSDEVNVHLCYLKKKRLVVHKSPYWCWK